MAEVRPVLLGDGTYSVEITGEFDLADVATAAALLDEATGTGAPGLLIDLTECEFIDSSGLRLLMQAHGEARRNGTRFAIAGSGPAVRRLFDLTGLDEHLPIFHDRQEAIQSVRATPPRREGYSD